MRDLPCTISRSHWAIWLHKNTGQYDTGDPPTHESVTLTGNTSFWIKHGPLLLGCYAERERRLHNASQGPQDPPSVPRALIMATPQHLPLYKKSRHKLKEALQIV